MLRLPSGVVGNCPFFFLLLVVTCFVHSALAQLETATVSGQVVDPSGLGVTGAHVKLVDIDRDTTTSAATNNSGLYTFASVHPGRYRMEVDATGFRIVNVTGLTLNVQDHIEQNFRLQIGSVAESVTVEASAQQVNTTDATVSTVVDRQFAENLPLNGRSFQSLIQLTPGVVLTANNGYDTGQFSVNGQRPSSNYWMVDGVSANIGIGATSSSYSNGLGGALGSTSVLGGTNSLVSVDAMQEFRIQTSTFAPEFGRTPGGQISIVTRSGTNQFHGTVFDYLRNEAFDAKNWFNGYTNNPPLPKAKERQNDFGGTLGGPILKNKTFFFFSYEGLRLRLPQTVLSFVPDASFTPGGTTNSRQNAIPALQPYLNAFPLPNPTSPEIFMPCDPTTDPTCPPSGEAAQGYAAFNASFSNPATLNAYSLRIDHKLSDKLNVLGRYDYSPSELSQRGSSGALSSVSPTRITTQTGTVGVTWAISTLAANDFRFNYSTTASSSSSSLDNFGGAVPLGVLPFPSPFTSQNGQFGFYIGTLGNYQSLGAGANANNRQRQLNFVDSVSLQRGPHAMKFGIDFRRLSPEVRPVAYGQMAYFSDVASTETGNPFQINVSSILPSTLLFRNLGVFAQDTWRIVPRLTLTYGLRWDTDFAPASLSGPGFAAAVGFNLNNLATLALAPAGTPPYKTTYGNVAPRIGLAYQLTQNPQWQTVLRGGFGVFYDLATSEAGNVAQTGSYPFGSTANLTGDSFPLSGNLADPPPVTPPNSASYTIPLYAFDPNLRLPYTLQWNAAIEQSLGKQQSLTASYIGSAGRRLLQPAYFEGPPPTFSCYPNYCVALVVTNASTSDYDALQLQFHRQVSHGLQALVSYTWSHSIDTASAGSFGNFSNLLSQLNANVNRGSSDFDIRNGFSMALTYDVPVHGNSPLANVIVRGWSVDNVVQARSASPVDVNYQLLGLASGSITNTRPDVVPGQPFYLYGSSYPGGKAFNAAAFTLPPLDPVSGNPLAQGNLPRNGLRGFGAAQWDFAVHRDFPLRESVKLQFRAEMFNLLNHPNFGPPASNLGYFGIPGTASSTFGLSTAMLGQSLAGQGTLGNGGFDPLYQFGGPRSMQFALKLFF